MNKFIYIIFIFILSCSLNSNSAFWSKSEKLKTDKKISKILFQDLKPNENEFNPKLKVNLPIKNTSVNYNFNNNGYLEIKKLDGEFAICLIDFKSNLLLISTSIIFILWFLFLLYLSN